jgi:hypothetical protein
MSKLFCMNFGLIYIYIQIDFDITYLQILLNRSSATCNNPNIQSCKEKYSISRGNIMVHPILAKMKGYISIRNVR